MSNKLTILQICWYKVFPAETGGQNGIALFYESLKKYCNLKFICSSNNSSINVNVLPILPVTKWQFLQWGSYKKILQQIKVHRPQFVIIEHPYYAFLLLFRKKYQFKLIIHQHNVEYKRLKMLGKWFWPIVYFMEKWAVKKAEYILVKTDVDAIFFKNEFKSLSTIIKVPYGTNQVYEEVDLLQRRIAAKATLKIDSNEKLLIYNASFDYKPNVEGLNHLLNDLVPTLSKLLEYKLIIFGKDLQKVVNENSFPISNNISFLDWVDDIDRYLIAADLIVNPVMNGEGVQTKIIEALSYHCSVVCYEKCSKGLPEYVINQKLFVAENANHFITQTITGLQSSNIHTNQLFFEEHNWDKNCRLILEKLAQD